jgi:dipeptidyl aminopeptidase/acylaminoacyl peptidase
MQRLRGGHFGDKMRTPTLMRHSMKRLAPGAVWPVALGILLAQNPASSQDTAGNGITIPVIGSNESPLVPFAPIAPDAHRGVGVLRKPPGAGPFPVIVLIHGGLVARPGIASGLPLSFPTQSRFLAAGYVVAAITYRSRNIDPQSKLPIDDSVAAIRYLQQLAYVDPRSVVVYGTSGGGDLALEVAAATDVAAIVAEEPATTLFTGVWNKSVPRAGDSYNARDTRHIVEDPMRFYSHEFQERTREKLSRIRCPILILQGDSEFPINRFNTLLFVPELRRAGKNVEVITYPGQGHGFAYQGAGDPAAVLKAFVDMEAFFRRYLNTKPIPIEPVSITQRPANPRPPEPENDSR